MILAASAILRLVEPWTALEANTLTVSQFANSNAAAIASQFAGNGAWLARLLVGVPGLALIAVIWLKKPR